MNYESLADKIIELSGGEKNIIDAAHCFTRIRFHLRDDKMAKIEELKNIQEVLEVQFLGGQFQVVLGSCVADVYNIVITKLGGSERPEAESKTSNKRENIFSMLLETISSIFAPIIPAIVGAGVMKGILALLVALGATTAKSGTYTVLYAISDAAFYFLPFLIAVTASRRFKLNEFYGLSLAGIMLYPTILGVTEPILLFGVIKIPVVSYASSVIPIILGVWFTSYVYKFFDKFIPKVLRLVITPVATLLISVPVTLIILGPLGFTLGTYVSIASSFLFTRVPVLAGLIVGFFYPFIIMTGMHLAYFPVMIQNIGTIGYDTGFLQVGLFSNIATAGAAFAVALKVKEANMKSIAASASVAAVLGTTEPALYGVEMKYKKPLYAVMLSGSITSGVALMLGVKCYGLVSPGLIAFPVYINSSGNYSNLIIAIVGSIIAFILAFVITWILGLEPSNKKSNEESKTSDTKDLVSAVKSNTKEIFLNSPITGVLKSLKMVEDKTFASESLGKGFAILPNEGLVFAPFSGIVSADLPTKHGIGLTSNDGVEILIHIGIDTVKLNGKYFEMLVSQGDLVKEGDLLIKFDLESIKAEKYDLTTSVIVTNTLDFMDVMPICMDKNVEAGQKILKLL